MSSILRPPQQTYSHSQLSLSHFQASTLIAHTAFLFFLLLAEFIITNWYPGSPNSLFKLPLLQRRPQFPFEPLSSRQAPIIADLRFAQPHFSTTKHNTLSPSTLGYRKAQQHKASSGNMACRRAVAKAMNQYAAIASIQPSCLQDPGEMGREETPGTELSDSSHPSQFCSLSPTPSSGRAASAPNAAPSVQKRTIPRRQRIRVSKVNGHVRLSVPLEPSHMKKKKKDAKEPAARTLPATRGPHHLGVIKKSGQVRLRISRSRPLQTERRFKVFIFRNGVGRRVTRLTALHKP